MSELINPSSPEIFVSLLPILAIVGITVLLLLMMLCVVGIVCECRSESRYDEESNFGLLPK